MQSRIRAIFRFSATACLLWLFTQAAMSSGALAPDAPLLQGIEQSAEYSLLQNLHKTFMDLQLMELTIKNRRNSTLEERLQRATIEVRSDADMLVKRLGAMRQQQNHLFEGFVDIALLKQDAKIDIGGEAVVKLRKVRGRTTLLGGVLNTNAALNKKIQQSNLIYEEALKELTAFQNESFASFHHSMENTRHFLKTRFEAAYRGINELARLNTSMGASEENSALFHQILDQLYSYGINITLSEGRVIPIQGFLFGSSPEEARRIYERLKQRGGSEPSYNSPNG